MLPFLYSWSSLSGYTQSRKNWAHAEAPSLPLDSAGPKRKARREAVGEADGLILGTQANLEGPDYILLQGMVMREEDEGSELTHLS